MAQLSKLPTHEEVCKNRAYECRHCSRRFKSEFELRKHELVFHRDKVVLKRNRGTVGTAPIDDADAMAEAEAESKASATLVSQRLKCHVLDIETTHKGTHEANEIIEVAIVALDMTPGLEEPSLETIYNRRFKPDNPPQHDAY